VSVDYRKVADLLIGAHRAARAFSPPAALALRSAEDAYRVQHMVFASLWPGERPKAWKIGAPSDEVEPTASPIHSVYRSPATVPAGGLNMIGIEVEIAFRVARDLPAREEPFPEADVTAAIGEALVAIELCDTRLADWSRAPALWKLADFQSNAALIVGSGTRDWRGIDFRSQRVELRIGERSIAALGAHPLGNPSHLLPRIAAHCARRTDGLRAGDVVTTGSWTGMEFALPGEEISARFPGIGEAVLRLAR
jgi:2-keto-4-pentenoate hydratase